MPIDLGEGIYQGLGALAQGLRQKFQNEHDELNKQQASSIFDLLNKAGFTQSQIPNPGPTVTLPGGSQATYQNVPNTQTSVTPMNPEIASLIAHLAANPQGQALLSAFQQSRKELEPQFKELPGGATYGTVTPNAQGVPTFNEQGTTQFKIPPVFGFDPTTGAPTVGMMQNGKFVTAPSPIKTTQMSNAENAKQKTANQAEQAKNRFAIQNVAVSAPQLNDKGEMGVTATSKTDGTTQWIPVGEKGQPKGSSAGISASTRTMLDAAPTVKYFVNKVLGEVQQNEQGLGPTAGRWREFTAGKVGISDPAFTQLRTNMGLLQTLLMRMHVGARGGEYIMKHFQDLINEGKQSPDNLKAALGEIGAYADQLLKEKETPTQTQGQPVVDDPLGILK